MILQKSYPNSTQNKRHSIVKPYYPTDFQLPFCHQRQLKNTQEETLLSVFTQPSCPFGISREKGMKKDFRAQKHHFQNKCCNFASSPTVAEQ